MKRNYIKPVMELLESGSVGILCASNGTQWGSNTGGTTTPIGDGEPAPNAREYSGDFDFDE